MRVYKGSEIDAIAERVRRERSAEGDILTKLGPVVVILGVILAVGAPAHDSLTSIAAQGLAGILAAYLGLGLMWEK